MKKIAIMASGSGTNAENIVRFFQDKDHSTVCVILTNNPRAGVIERARNLNVPVIKFDRADLSENQLVLKELKRLDIDLIVLAGFLWLIPSSLISAFPKRIINIHPALLPAYGGKGMYGNHVHKAVISNGEKESGITIHLIDEEYDRGSNLFQKKCEVKPDDTPESLARRIHELEYRYFPKVIEEYLESIP